MAGQPSEFVGSIPAHYDRGLGPVIFEDYALDIARRAASLAPSDVLELAAGTGLVSRHLRDQIPPAANLLVTDLNLPMLDVARTKFSKGERISFEQADAMNLAYPDNSFDTVICQFGVMFFPDKVASFREARRVLRPGGTYVFNVWGRLEDNAFANITQHVSDTAFPDDPPGFYRVPFSYADAEKVGQDLRAAGFQSVETVPIELTKELHDVRAFAEGIVYGNPLIDEINNRNTIRPENFMDTIEQRFREAWPGNPPAMTMKAAVFLAS